MTFLSSLLVNLTIQVHGKKGSKLTTPDKFLPPWLIEPIVQRSQTVDEMKQILLSIAAAQNEKVKKEKRGTKT